MIPFLPKRKKDKKKTIVIKKATENIERCWWSFSKLRLELDAKKKGIPRTVNWMLKREKLDKKKGKGEKEYLQILTEGTWLILSQSSPCWTSSTLTLLLNSLGICTRVTTWWKISTDVESFPIFLQYLIRKLESLGMAHSSTFHYFTLPKPWSPRCFSWENSIEWQIISWPPKRIHPKFQHS